MTRLVLAFMLVLAHAALAAAQGAAPIRYTLSFPAPQTHYVEVSAQVPTGGQAAVELMMPVWTPGSYLVREFERHVEAVTASGNGRMLAITKSAKNRWRITTSGAPTVTVNYRVYAREMTVRTNWVDAEFASLNGAPTFMTLADLAPRPHEVIINLPAAWKRSISGLADLGGGANRYVAPNYDILVDSPILIGNPAVNEFTVEGKTHYLATVGGDNGIFDNARAAADAEKIVRENLKFWGSLPYDKYVFLNVLTEVASGGLEHLNSTLLVVNRWTDRTAGGRRQWLELASHEFFHVWNVKRLRPAELGPFKYEQENYTPSLWIAEGVTEYYSYVILKRAGLITEGEFLDGISGEVELLQTTPGREVQSASLASMDAWIKYYRPDENSANVAISYYTKGLVLGLVIDAKIRKATNNARSLDDVMKQAFAKYSGPRGYTHDEFRQVAEQVAGMNLEAFWRSAVDSTDELDYAEVTEMFGLRFRRGLPSGQAWTGLITANNNGRLLVTQVRRGTPGFEAGFNVDDEILALDDFRVRPEQLAARLGIYRSGDRVSVLVARREQLRRLDLTFGSQPPSEWRLEVAPNATETQNRARQRWLSAAA
jgi:predicted metalloprotease with PDZ domain